jgi:hypothetical protein
MILFAYLFAPAPAHGGAGWLRSAASAAREPSGRRGGRRLQERLPRGGAITARQSTAPARSTTLRCDAFLGCRSILCSIQVVLRDVWDHRRGAPKREPTIGEERVPVDAAAGPEDQVRRRSTTGDLDSPAQPEADSGPVPRR